MKSTVIILVIITTVTTLVGGQTYFEIDGNRYMLSTPIQKNWHQAVRHCYLNGMYLLDLATRDEYTKILKYLRDHVDEIPKTNYWTSGTSAGSQGEFYWSITGKSIVYNGFPKGQPDNNAGDEECIELNAEVFNFDWNDNSCYEVRPFICRATRYTNLKPRVSGSRRH